MNWMSVVFAVEAVLYLVCLVFFIIALIQEWREECQDSMTWFAFVLSFYCVVSLVGLVIAAVSAYSVNNEWQLLSWTGLLVSLAWASWLGIAYFAYDLFVSDIIWRAKFKKANARGAQTRA
jgi:hypothetical protein